MATKHVSKLYSENEFNMRVDLGIAPCIQYVCMYECHSQDINSFIWKIQVVNSIGLRSIHLSIVLWTVDR